MCDNAAIKCCPAQYWKKKKKQKKNLIQVSIKSLDQRINSINAVEKTRDETSQRGQTKELYQFATIRQTIRLHYGFQSTGSHFIDFVDIHLQPDERPEYLYQRPVAFVEDNLLQRDSQILHHGDVTTVDEECSPSLENMIVLTWLRLINTALPKLVKQRYGTEH